MQLRDHNTDFQVYDGFKQLVISFPNLDVGDAVEVKWTLRGREPECQGHFYDLHMMGHDEFPTVREEGDEDWLRQLISLAGPQLAVLPLCDARFDKLLTEPQARAVLARVEGLRDGARTDVHCEERVEPRARGRLRNANVHADDPRRQVRRAGSPHPRR